MAYTGWIQGLMTSGILPEVLVNELDFRGSYMANLSEPLLHGYPII